MSKTKTPAGAKVTPAKREPPDDVPQFFRLNVEVGDLDAAFAFYTRLLGVQGRKQPGHRCYFDCGPVTLQVLDVSSNGHPHLAAKALYFTVENLEAAFDRAKALSCLSREDVHGAPAGGIVVRPWGERSFYVDDPWGNPLCFVEEGTVYTG
ncbi:MAG TPA: VOC family protein [Vicinamibacterales bacterium]|jgi:catechol 2,3-dioxygenase-like lactoylglutathione lyase family enzyme|nr:VOC family protein [Vicinamibacterales bacterium]